MELNTRLKIILAKLELNIKLNMQEKRFLIKSGLRSLFI